MDADEASLIVKETRTIKEKTCILLQLYRSVNLCEWLQIRGGPSLPTTLEVFSQVQRFTGDKEHYRRRLDYILTGLANNNMEHMVLHFKHKTSTRVTESWELTLMFQKVLVPRQYVMCFCIDLWKWSLSSNGDRLFQIQVPWEFWKLKFRHTGETTLPNGYVCFRHQNWMLLEPR